MIAGSIQEPAVGSDLKVLNPNFKFRIADCERYLS